MNAPFRAGEPHKADLDVAIIRAAFSGPAWLSHSKRQATPRFESSKRRTISEGRGGMIAIQAAPVTHPPLFIFV
jgi:hypothetical protein